MIFKNFVFLAGSMAAGIFQSIPRHSCVARAGSGEKHFQTLQGKEPLIIMFKLPLRRLSVRNVAVGCKGS